MKAEGMDMLALGHQFFRLPLIAHQLGHVSPKESLAYIHPTNIEGEYMRELLLLMDGEGGPDRLSAFSERWFGGEDGVRLLLKNIYERPAHDPAHDDPDQAA
jgi:hypothetical protein